MTATRLVSSSHTASCGRRQSSSAEDGLRDGGFTPGDERMWGVSHAKAQRREDFYASIRMRQPEKSRRSSGTMSSDRCSEVVIHQKRRSSLELQIAQKATAIWCQNMRQPASVAEANDLGKRANSPIRSSLASTGIASIES